MRRPPTVDHLSCYADGAFHFGGKQHRHETKHVVCAVWGSVALLDQAKSPAFTAAGLP
jgi:hypothetical protein